ncbi:MAG: ATP-binding protein [Candidatus Methanomethylicota archaeon]|uniref:ATP-binding protein n=1 Tax=Thermoproteota archaeon TaxID=2056631 RepID=A0A497EKH5_9CREN|nr:MAG: ATP-binding protein [Candidatus Verstraetearchaeota archaeon]
MRCYPLHDAIVADRLTKYYGDFLAVDHISFRVREGEIYGFLGPNGAGKTTTIRMLCGLTKISEGKAFIYGYDVSKNLVTIKKIIGVVQDISNLYMELSCYDNLMFCAEMYGVPRSRRKERVMKLLEFFGLENKMNAKFKELSKGLKRRLTIAAALVHEPKILFLDEPTIGLDVRSKRQIWKLIRRLNKEGLTIFLTTHNIYEAFKLCDRIAIINRGRIIAEGTPAELRKKVSGSKIIELQVSPPINEKAIFESLNGIIDVNVGQDNTIYIKVSDAITALEEIINIIKRLNLEIVMLSLRGADAEDIFIRIIDETEKKRRITS